LLEARNLGKHFDVSRSWLTRVLEREPRRILKAVDGVDFAIARGETFSLVGESGCGKTTVGRLAVGQLAPTFGTLTFDGTEVGALRARADQRAFRRRIQLIFQDPYASLNPRWRVRDTVAEPLRALGAVQGRRARRERVDELLEQVGLSPEDGRKYPHEFSGGQRQRISIARALSSRPEFIVCDEPTSALDVSVQAQILNLMKDLQQAFGLTYLFISHNLAVVYHMSDRIGVMYLGRLCEVASAEELFTRPRHPYTRLLLQAIPDPDRPNRDRSPAPGEVPSPIDPPAGCAFHPRCAFAEPRCAREIPALKRDGPTVVACHGVEEKRIPPAAPQDPPSGP
jgi:peptide/nickel transport system ATP-binding protein